MLKMSKMGFFGQIFAKITLTKFEYFDADPVFNFTLPKNFAQAQLWVLLLPLSAH